MDMEEMEQTLVFLKPDALRRGLVGRIIGRFERRGLQILAMKMTRLTEEFAREHYAEHRGKHFYEPLVEYSTSGPVIAMVLGGKNAVRVVREMMGETFGSESAPGTIRGDFGLSDRYNLLHGSDSRETAREEIQRFFDDHEIAPMNMDELEWIYDLTGSEPV